MQGRLNNKNKELLSGKEENQSGEYTLNYTKIHLYKLKLCEISIIYQRSANQFALFLCDVSVEIAHK